MVPTVMYKSSCRRVPLAAVPQTNVRTPWGTACRFCLRKPLPPACRPQTSDSCSTTRMTIQTVSRLQVWQRCSGALLPGAQPTTTQLLLQPTHLACFCCCRSPCQPVLLQALLPALLPFLLSECSLHFSHSRTGDHHHHKQDTGTCLYAQFSPSQLPAWDGPSCTCANTPH